MIYFSQSCERLRFGAYVTMLSGPRIAVVGNCQAQMIAGLLVTGGECTLVSRFPPNYLWSESDREPVHHMLDGADFIFAQRVSPKFRLDWLQSKSLRARYGDKVIIWPNIYFDGYFPDLKYVYLPDIGKLQGPLDDYHHNSIMSSFKLGRSEGEACEHFMHQMVDPAADYFSESIDRLRLRETQVDVCISDYIEHNVPRQKLFYTPNHPSNIVLSEMASRLASRGSFPFDLARASEFAYRLDKVSVPCHPSLKARYNLPFDSDFTFRGVDFEVVNQSSIRLGQNRSYSLSEIVKAFFYVYGIAKL